LDGMVDEVEPSWSGEDGMIHCTCCIRYAFLMISLSLLSPPSRSLPALSLLSSCRQVY
jgi:hypothetical protein